MEYEGVHLRQATDTFVGSLKMLAWNLSQGISTTPAPMLPHRLQRVLAMNTIQFHLDADDIIKGALSQPCPTQLSPPCSGGIGRTINDRNPSPLGARNLEDENLMEIMTSLRRLGVDVYESRGRCLPPGATMHDRAAVIPKVVVSPHSEQGVMDVLKTLSISKMYQRHAVSVRSGGHGYFNGASCPGIMINLANMNKRQVIADTLHLEPGCILGQIIGTLAAHDKAVPHGDCFGVAAGGHFLTAGWDIALARRHGLGCQSVVGGRIVLWDGSVVDVDDKNHPRLLFAMRGGAAAGVGIVTEIRLQLKPQPESVSWCFQSISRAQLETCIAHQAFAAAARLPNDVTVSFRFHFEPDQSEPVCSFNVVSLLSAKETMERLDAILGIQVTSLLAEPSEWHEKSLLDFRMIPASDALVADPSLLRESTPISLHENPLSYWKPETSSREMASSYLASVSHWIVHDCDKMLLELYTEFQAIPEQARGRVYALIVQGGGRMSELQHRCSMPLGQALGRFEVHWDDPTDQRWSEDCVKSVSAIIESKLDPGPGRPYRGDIWQEEQGQDDALDGIRQMYNRPAG
jgi:hypothetical protein